MVVMAAIYKIKGVQMSSDAENVVLIAENGEQAFEILATKPHLDLMITDYRLPGGVSGVMIAEPAVKLRPELKVIFISDPEPAQLILANKKTGVCRFFCALGFSPDQRFSSRSSPGPSPSADRMRRAWMIVLGFAEVARQEQLHRGAIAHLAFDGHMAMRLLGEAVNHRQTQPGALANGLGGEERVEGAADDVLRHTAASVADAEHHVIARQQVFVGVGVVPLKAAVEGLDHQHAAIGHRVARVEHQIEQGALELIGVGFGGPQFRVQAHVQADALVDAAVQQFAHGVDQVIHQHRLGVQRLSTRKRQQTVGQGGCAIGRTHAQIDQAVEVVQTSPGYASPEQFQAADDAGQHVVEVVGDTAGELAHRFHLLRLAKHFFVVAQLGGAFLDLLFQRLVEAAQLMLGQLALGDVGGHAGEQADPAVTRSDRPGTDVDPMHRTIRPHVTKLDDEVGTGVQRLLQDRLHARLVFGMHRGEPVVVSKRITLIATVVRARDSRALQHKKLGVQLPRSQTPGLQRMLQALLAFEQIFQPRAGFILSPAASHRGADQAHERRGMERPLQKRYVTEHFAKVRRGVLFTAVMSQQHDGKVRPGRLVGQQTQQRIDVRTPQGLVRNNGQPCAGYQLTAQLRQIMGNDCRIAAFLKHGQGDLAVPSVGGQNDGPLRYAAHFAQRFEVAQQNDRVSQVGDVHRRIHVTDQAVLGNGHEGRRALAIEVEQQLMDVQDQRIFFWHRSLIAIQAVEDDGLDVQLIDAAAHPMGELARRQLGGVHLLNHQIAGLHQRLEVDAKLHHAFVQQADLFIEYEQRSFLAALHGRHGEHQRNQRFAGAGWAKNQRAGTAVETAAKQGVNFLDAAAELLADVASAVLGGYQARKHLDAIGHDIEVVVTAAVLLATVFDHPQASALCAISRGLHLQANHAMGNAVDGLVQGFGGEVVQQDDRRVVAREIVLDREDLPAVAQRTLRQQADLRQAVDDHTCGLDLLDDLENLLGGFAQFKVR
nr:hypothetical protein [Tanacetum cinerariifolium]